MRPWLSVAGHALHAVDARLVAQLAVGVRAAHHEDRLLHAARAALGDG